MRTIVPFVLAFAIPAVLIAQPGAPPQIGFIEKKIADGTENLQDRITLMNLYLNARNVEKRREQVLWLAEHHPEIPNFRNPPFDLGPIGSLPDSVGFEREADIWRGYAAKSDAPPPALVNAAFFFRFADREFARTILQRLAADHPGNADIGKLRGTFDMLEMAGLVEGGPFRISSDPKLRELPAARQARQEIESSADANLICGAAEFLTQQAFAFNTPFDTEPPLGADDPLDLAEKWLLRAREIDPENKGVKNALGQVYANQGNQAADPKYKVALLRKADALIENWFGLPQLAMAEFDAGDDEAASKTVQRLLDRKPPQPNFVNMAHTVLGLIALEHKNVDEAKKELFESIRVKGNLNPNRALAQALADAGERDAVIEYLNQSREVWMFDNGAIDHYIKMLKVPGSHDITAFYFPGQDFRGREAAKLPEDVYKGNFNNQSFALQFRNASCKDCAKQFETIEDAALPRGVKAVSIDAAGHDSLVRQYGIETFPTLVLVNDMGRIVEFQPGRLNENNLTSALERLMGRDRRQRLPAPIQIGMLTWKAVPGAESYMVQLDQKDDQGWLSDRDEHLVRVIPASGTTASLDASLGETSHQVIRWRVFAVTRQGPGIISEWREERLKQP